MPNSGMLTADCSCRTNSSSHYAPESKYISVATGVSVYSYNAKTLWLAYGLAILFSVLSVAAGLYAIFVSGRSYSKHFSTIVRVARTADLSEDVLEHERSGEDPLPRRLKHARLDFGGVGLLQRSVSKEAHEKFSSPSEGQSLVNN